MTKPREIDPQTKEHIERFLLSLKEGKHIWNDWANDMLEQKLALKKAGKWQVNLILDNSSRFREFSNIPEVQAWLDKATIDFSFLVFQAEFGSYGVTNREKRNFIEANPVLKTILVPGRIIDFSNLIFPSGVDFTETRFSDEVIFRACQFKDGAYFFKSQFKSDAIFFASRFEGASTMHFKGMFKQQFKSTTNFCLAQFEGMAIFFSAHFKGITIFAFADFYKNTNFQKTIFYQNAFFSAIDGKRAFLLEGSQFLTKVPNFNQAHFAESPQLDHVEVRSKPTLKYFFPSVRSLLTRLNEKTDLRKWPRLDRWRKRFLVREHLLTQHNIALLQHANAQFDNAHEKDKNGNIKRDPNEEAYFRSLKRLAIQAHDHENELKFFAGELRARRFVRDFPYQKGVASALRYWAGVLYEITSDFGRSIWRPAAWWGATFALFASLYFANADQGALKKCREGQAITPFAAANTIAAKHSLPFFTMDRSDKFKRSLGCLYGATPLYHASYYAQKESGQPKAHPSPKSPPKPKFHMAPAVPGWVTVLGVLNMVLSLVFLFLLLLAIRNQFRIK